MEEWKKPEKNQELHAKFRERNIINLMIFSSILSNLSFVLLIEF